MGEASERRGTAIDAVAASRRSMPSRRPAAICRRAASCTAVNAADCVEAPGHALPVSRPGVPRD
jgi:hypothetical protein